MLTCQLFYNISSYVIKAKLQYANQSQPYTYQYKAKLYVIKLKLYIIDYR